MRKSRRLSTARWTRHYSEPYLSSDPETGEPEPSSREVEVAGCRIDDHDSGLVYRVTIEERRGGAVVTFLSVETTGEGQQVADLLPTSELIRHAREVRSEVKQHGARVVQPVHVPGTKPTLDQLARDYPTHNRETLAQRYGVSPSTLDRWIREARDTTNPHTGKPYLGKARTGRPPKNSHTPGGTSSPGDHNK